MGLAGVWKGLESPTVTPSCPHADLRGKERLLLPWKLMRM